MTIAHLSLLGLGGLLMAIPVLLHFLMQPKPVVMQFPAIRFLQQRHSSNRSRMRLRHLILLILRCLLIAVLALALAGPSVASEDFGNWLTLGSIGATTVVVGLLAGLAYFRENRNLLLVSVLAAVTTGLLCYLGWTAGQIFSKEGSGQIIGASNEPVAAIVLVDTSPTMGYQFNNQTRLELAQSYAQDLVARFPIESQVCVTATDDDSPFFSVDTSAADRRLEKLEITYNASSIPYALGRALPLLEKSDQNRKEVYIFTDLTKKSWNAKEAGAAVRRLAKDESVGVFVVDVGVEDPTNTSLSPLRLSDARISRRGELLVDVQVDHIGGPTQKPVELKILKPDPARPVVRDGQILYPQTALNQQTQTVSLNPTDENNGFASASVSFQFSDQLDEGTYHGSVGIAGADGLADDDRRFFTFEVRRSIPMLAIHGQDTSPDILLDAIAPDRNREGNESASKFACQLAAQFSINEETDFLPYEVIFLLDPEPINDAVWEKLHAFVESGGRLAILLGHNAVTKGSPHPSFLTEQAIELMGGKLSFPFRAADGDVIISTGELIHPLFEKFRAYATSVPWDRHPVYYHWGIERDESWDRLPTEVILRYTNREPALIERTIGAGRVLTMTTSLSDPAYSPNREVWNDLWVGAPWPTFILAVEMANYLGDADLQPINIQVGQSGILNNDLSEYPDTYRVFPPVQDKSPTSVTTADGRVSFRFVDAPGHYYLNSIVDGQMLQRGFSANLHPQETNLERSEPAELDLVLGAGRYQLARSQDELEIQQGTSRRGQEFFPLLLLMALVMMAIEHLLSNRFYKN